MNTYLIKRSSKISDGAEFSYDLKGGWYSEVSLFGKPRFSDKLSTGDIIYVAESGYAIFGKAKVANVIFKSFNNLEDFTDYVVTSAKTQHERYWFGKLKHAFKNYNGKSKIGVLEFELVDATTFDLPFILEKRFLNTNTWYSIEENYELEKVPIIKSNLNKYIPTALRKNLFQKYKLQGDSHIIDIDHHVPKSLGGPGNIEENLVPLSIFQNRTKSNSVPSRLFFHAKEFNIKVPADTLISPSNYIKTNKHLAVAKQIIAEINKDINIAKRVYLDVKLYHFPYCI
jgi:hypothetical protein